ncbi:DUF1217 domain-containing protein [Hoeflea sp.]|uniref:DUF1217 domain-containing protein n=1 Tax=Hoeflea sp. TaxID=1940281 RepID=UPI003BAFC01A
MFSTSYQSYTFYARDLTLSLQRKADDPIVAREAEYYKQTIGSITTLDEFMADDRIYNYAMKAYGLEEMGYAKALIRKVLESDLTDSNSFANRLEDVKYRNLAAAFDFGKTVTSEVVQTTTQIDNLIETYGQTIADNDEVLKQETAYFRAVSATITEVDDIFQNTRLRDYVFQTFKIDSETYDYETIKNVITSDISDPSSFVNTEFVPKILEWDTIVMDLYDERILPGNTAADRERIDYLIAQYSKMIDKANSYFELAASFNFNPDGTLDPVLPVQTEAQQKMVTERYVFDQPRLTTTGALLNKAYYEEQIGSITTINDLLDNGRMATIMLESFGISLNTSRADIEWTLQQDPSDPDSPVHAKGKAFAALAAAFNFESDGTLAAGVPAQDTDQQYAMLSEYIVRFDDADEKQDEDTIRNYKRYIGLTASLDDFLSPAGAAVVVREFALKAFNITPGEVSTYKLKKIFTSDPYDPKSYLNTLGDERFVRLAKAFNFAPDGSIGTPRFAQSENEITRLSKAYYVEMTRLDDSQAAKDKAEDEVSYYRSRMQTLETVGEIVSDPRLVNFLLVAEGLDPADIKPDTLRSILLSDLQDPRSFANTQGDIRFQKLAGSFNFNAEGFVVAAKETGVQNDRGQIETTNFYLTQMLEEEAGQDNVGARLALYFKRMAPSINSVYTILADTALAEFIRTSFSIPAETASSDIDMQAALLEDRLDVEDLQDPEKVDVMIQRFLALHDLENGTPNPVLSVFSGNATINYETVAALAQLRTGSGF